MIFLIPLLIIFGVIFGIDYFYFQKENQEAKIQKTTKEKSVTKEEYLDNLFKK